MIAAASGVGLEQPAAWRDAGGLVLKFPRIERVEFREEILLQQRRVQRRDAIHRMAAGHGEIRHAHGLAVVLMDQRTDLFLGVVAGPLQLDRLHQPFVDIENNLEVAWQHAFEQRHAPLFQRLGEQGMVGVGKRLRDDAPRRVPLHGVFVQKNAHQLDDRDCRVRVVELDGDLVGEVAPRVGGLAEVPAQDVAQRTGDKEILLHEPQLLARLALVVRIKDL